MPKGVCVHAAKEQVRPNSVNLALNALKVDLAGADGWPLL
jgi:hypothetical protein